ncbi:hypothetical protein [Terribacillus sp. JSM ZJ617]|uniref:hypothetical protein n=1 Tax=Terribacillus sp. JSM ZJ617 TaxID=3342119 RepID=UPI0035A96FF6
MEVKENLTEKKPFYKKSKFIGILALVIIGVSLTWYLISQHKSQQAAAEEERENREEEYIELLSNTTDAINQVNESSRQIIYMYSDVWNVTIENDLYVSAIAEYLGVEESVVIDNVPTDKIRVNPRGEYIGRGDFNAALETVRNVLLSEGIYDSMENAQTTIEDNVKELKNPPEKYRELHEDFEDYYSNHSIYVSLATSPTGSYLTYTRDTSNLLTELGGQYSSLELELP